MPLPPVDRKAEYGEPMRTLAPWQDGRIYPNDAFLREAAHLCELAPESCKNASTALG